MIYLHKILPFLLSPLVLAILLLAVGVIVTSAYHMPRAQRQFETQGFEVEAFPVDFKVRARAMTPMDFMPDPRALRLTDIVVREWLGGLYYRILRGL